MLVKAIFKHHNQNQLYLIPPTWEEKIPDKHPVRIINRIIDTLNLDDIYGSYCGGGASSYDPRLLLKALVYSYINNVFSSRKIEEMIKSNIHYIWLCSGSEPDHNTINRFRSSKLENYLKPVFKEIVLLLSENGLLSIEEIYTDGTKIEANANKYTFVWGKAIATNKKKMVERIDELWKYANQVAQKELTDTTPITYTNISKEKIERKIAEIQELLNEQNVPKKIKNKIDYVKKNYPNKITEYEAKEKILDGRNSYSKTDNDATFMRMKEDHMGNGQLKPGYNLQISTNNQIIVNYDLYANPTDTLTLPSHIDSYHNLYNKYPLTITADAGYGSEENYEYFEKNGINSFVKYNNFYQDTTGKRMRKYPFAQDYLYYNAEKDYFVCPMGQHMNKLDTKKKQSKEGYIHNITRYKAINCTNCPIKCRCTKAKGDRIIEVNHKLNNYKTKAKEKLLSTEGIHHRKQRNIEPEPVFGNIKHNKHFRRFLLRGKNKVAIEIGLLAIAHNCSKLFNQ